jgi:hypothetical protein
MATTMTQLRAGGATAEGPSLFEQLLAKTPRFDPDAYHVMQQRDSALIEDELMHGASSKAFVYDFSISGARITGVSVVGARQLASEYGGIKSRIVATVDKRGALFVFRSFEPLTITTAHLPDLADETDFYECIMQVDDIKTGNSTQVRKKELKTEQRSAAKGGGTYDRPHYDVIAESKARRNGILDVLPQKVIQDFKVKHLAQGNASAEKTMDQLRSGATAFAAKHGLTLGRAALAGMTHADLLGLGNAAAMGVDSFRIASSALGLIEAATGELTGSAAPAPAKPAQRPATPAEQVAQQVAPGKLASEWEPTPQELAGIQARELAEAQGGDAQAATKTRRTRSNMPDVA